MQQDKKLETKTSDISWPYRTPPSSPRSQLTPSRFHQCRINYANGGLSPQNLQSSPLPSCRNLSPSTDGNDGDADSDDVLSRNGDITAPRDSRSKLSCQKQVLTQAESPIGIFSRQTRECAGGVEQKIMPPCSCSQKSISLAARVQSLKAQSESPRTWKDENPRSFNLRGNTRCDEQTCAVDWELPGPQLDIMFQQLSNPHYREVTADLIVKIGNQAFRAHRFLLAHFSKYFYTLLQQRQGKLFMEVVLRDISPESFTIICEWMYSSQLCISPQNLLDVLYTAQFLEIPEVIVHCMEYLNQMVTTPDNLLVFYDQAYQTGRRGLMEHILRLLAIVYCRIITHPGFINLDFEAMKFLLTCDNLNVNCERDVFDSACAWLMSNLESRKQFVVDLMSCVRFAQMSEPELFECLHNDHCQVIMSFPECRLMVLQGYLFHTSQSLGNLDKYPHLFIPPRRSLWEQMQDSDQPMIDTCRKRCFSPLMTSPRNTPVTYHLCDYPGQPSQIYPGCAPCWKPTSTPCALPKMECVYPSGRIQEDILGQNCLMDEANRKRCGWPKWWAKDKDCKLNDRFDFGLQCPAILQAECLVRKMGSPPPTIKRPIHLPCQPRCQTPCQPQPIGRMTCGGCTQLPYTMPSPCIPCNAMDMNFQFQQQQQQQQPCSQIKNSWKHWSLLDTTSFNDIPEDSAVPQVEHQEQQEQSPQQQPQESPVMSPCPEPCPCMSNQVFDECEEIVEDGQLTILLLGGLNPLESWSGQTAGKMMYVYSKKCSFEKTLGTWKKFDQLPIPRHHASATVLLGYVYISGGCCPNKSKDGRAIVAISSVWRLHIKSMQWDKKADMLRARIHHGFVALNGTILALGGQDETGEILDSVESYSPTEDKWHVITTLSTPRMGMGAAVFRNEVWICGGMSIKNKDKSPTITKTVESYDHRNNRWTVMSPIRFPRCFGSLIEYNGLLHLVGGVTRVSAHKDGVISSVASVDVHEPISDEWSFKTSLQVPRHNAVTAVFDTKLFVIGGVTSLEACALDCVECYNDAKPGWEKGLPHLPIPLSGLSCVVVKVPDDTNL